MKKLALVMMLLFSALAWAGGKANPADCNINVRVSSSRLNDPGSLRLKVVIDGTKCELDGDINNPLVSGGYKARLAKDEHRPAYDSYQVYEFPFPDKKTRQYRLVGISE
jgi:hypothetical protein